MIPKMYQEGYRQVCNQSKNNSNFNEIELSQVTSPQLIVWITVTPRLLLSYLISHLHHDLHFVVYDGCWQFPPSCLHSSQWEGEKGRAHPLGQNLELHKSLLLYSALLELNQVAITNWKGSWEINIVQLSSHRPSGFLLSKKELGNRYWETTSIFCYKE